MYIIDTFFGFVTQTLKAIIQPVVLQTAEDLKSIMEELQELRFQSIKHSLLISNKNNVVFFYKYC